MAKIVSRFLLQTVNIFVLQGPLTLHFLICAPRALFVYGSTQTIFTLHLMICLWCGGEYQPVLNSLNLFFGSETKRQYAIVPTFPPALQCFYARRGVFNFQMMSAEGQTSGGLLDLLLCLLELPGVLRGSLPLDLGHSELDQLH